MARVAIVGGGSVSQLHAQAIRLVPEAELLGFVGSAGAQMRATEFSTQQWPTLEAAAHAGADIAVICTPTGTHAEIGTRAAGLGMNILVEKAMDTSLAAARSLVAAAEDNGVVLGVVSQGQFELPFEELLSAVESGRLGVPTLASASRKCWRDRQYYRGWHGTHAMDGGGAMINQGIHKVDQLCRLMGRARRVTGWTRTLAHAIEVEDTAIALVEFDNGAVGTIEATTAFYSAGATPTEQTTVDTLQLSGDAGSAVISKGVLSTSWSGVSGPPPAVAHGARLDLFRRQHEDFVHALAEGRAPRVTGQEGLNALELVLAVYESARSGTTIELDDWAEAPRLDFSQGSAHR